MSALHPIIGFAVWASLGGQMVGCHSMTGTADRRLQTVALRPAHATGHDTSVGQVQFVATGSFTAPPSPVTPLLASGWFVSDPAIAAVSNSGVAQCLPGTAGAVTVQAIASSGSDMPGTATAITGTAELTCP